MARIVVIGAVARDEVIRLTGPLRAGGHLNGVADGIRLGGGGANTALALAAAGHAVRLLAAVGHDAGGDALLAELAAAGVDTSAIVRLDQPTTHSLLCIDPDGERTVINLCRCEEHDPPERLLDMPADLVYVRSRRADLAPLLTATAQRGAQIVAHLPPSLPGSRPAFILLASASDLSKQERRSLWALGRCVAGDQVRWVVMTEGAAGARAVNEQEQHRVAAEPVQALDTTGAGDAFAAGLLHGLACGQALPEALAMAVRFGTESIRWTRSALPVVVVQRLLAARRVWNA